MVTGDLVGYRGLMQTVEGSMEIYSLPALSDNYIFLLHDPDQHVAAVVDAGDAGPVLAELKRLKAKLVTIFNTHYDGDHIAGNRALIAAFPEVVVYGGERSRGRIPGQNLFLSEGSRVSFGGRSAVVLDLPGHTKDHIAYYFAPVEDGVGELFCGDVLFAGGCGRVKEGTPEQSVVALDRVRQLPDETRVWCAHEYTAANLRFAITVDPGNRELQERYAQVQRSPQTPTIPTMLDLEKRTNPFLRWDSPVIQAFTGKRDRTDVFYALRCRKEAF
jgi:hydroxyacylglutathione hydrolase